jgi:GTP-binding protein
MVPADTEDIKNEYEILLNELATFNPEMLDKQRVLAVTKCDLVDQDLIELLEPTLPEGIPHVFISAISGLGIAQLKDILWTELNRESNQLKGTETLVHRAKDRTILPEELRDMGEDEDLTVGVEDVPEDLDDFDYEYEEDEE